MANEVLHKVGTPIVFAHASDFANVPYDDTVAMDLSANTGTGLAAGLSWQSAKVDLGATRARQYAVRVGVELNADLAAAGTIEVYWSSSPSGTAATGNTGGASGADAVYTESATVQIDQLMLIGVMSLSITCDADICYQAVCGMFTPPDRYGSVILKNNTAQALESVADTMYVALIPIVDEIQ